MLSRKQAITQLHEYKVAFDEVEWQRPTDRKPGEFGIFAIIIRIIGGLFIFGMVLVAIVGFIALIGLEASWWDATGVIGIVATLFASWKFRTSYRTLEKQYSFTGLLLLSVLLVGKACLLVALFGWFTGGDFFRPSILLVAFIFGAITCASLFYYRMYLEAFFSVLVAAFLLNFALANQIWTGLINADVLSQMRLENNRLPDVIIMQWYFVQTLLISLPLAAIAILAFVQKKRYLSSVYAYALLALVGYLLYPSQKLFILLMEVPSSSYSINWSMSIVIFFATVALYVHLVPNWRQDNKLAHGLVLAAIALLSFLGVYGVLFALALMAWGHVRHDRVLWITGLLYLPAYLIAFYYTLDLSLLTKSYLLLANGIVVLGARFLLVRFVGENKEQAHG